jgi:hypothetical protein
VDLHWYFLPLAGAVPPRWWARCTPRWLARSPRWLVGLVPRWLAGLHRRAWV